MNRIPVTRAWGTRLALGTALISGVAVWLNVSAVRAVGDPAVYTTLKNLVAAAILIAAAAAMGGASEVRGLRPGQWGRLMVLGIVGGSLPFLLFFVGLSMATAPSAAFIHKTLFVWVALLAVPLLGERIGSTQIAALVVLFVGQLLLVAPATGGSPGPGEAMILGATLLWSIEVIVAKRLLVGVSPAVVGAARLGFGLLILVGYVIATGKFTVLAGLSAGAVAWVLVTGVLLAGYVGTWLAALRRAPATVVTAMLVAGAMITALLDTLVGGAELQVIPLIGLAIIGTAAVWLVRMAGPEVIAPEAAGRPMATELRP